MNIENETKVIVCGWMCDNDTVISALLDRFNIPNLILRPASKQLALNSLNRTNIFYYTKTKEVSALFKKIKPKLVISINGGIVSSTGFKIDLFGLPNKPTIFELACGSDLAEIEQRNTAFDLRYKRHVKKADVVFALPYPEITKRLKFVKNWIISKPLYYELSGRLPAATPTTDQTIRFFHCSHLDWGATDYRAERTICKGNDKFLRAFKRAIESGLNVHCDILYRGPDKDLAKEFINSNNLQQYFTWHDSLNRQELHRFMINTDVVVDQFDCGAFGGIACEGMAQAKPIMVYVDNNCWPLAYDTPPPVINCRTEDEIYAAIIEWSDRKKLEALGLEAEKWVRKYHDIHQSDYSKFILRVCTAIGLSWPRVDLADAK